MDRHNHGWTRTTRGRGFWELRYIEECKDRTEALRREKEIKARKSKKYIEKLIQKYSSEGGVGIKQN